MFAFKDSNCSEVRIMDLFGATVVAYPWQKLTQRVGAPGYVAPEMLQDKGYDCKADMFSLGVIFFAIMTGRMLFQGSNLNDILEKNKNCDYDPLQNNFSRFSVLARDLFDKLVKENPEERITAAEALEHPWLNEQNQQAAQ